MVSKLNVNIRTLLSNCEELAKDEMNYWRLRKFIKSLDIMINELSEIDDPAGNEKIADYYERLKNLKKQTNYTDSSLSMKSFKNAKVREPSVEMGDDALREIRQLQTSKNLVEIRKELLHEDTLRKRKSAVDGAGNEQSEAVKYMRENQEKITEHMLSLTRNLKEQTVTANRIIKEDTEVVARSAGMADCNIGALNKETEKLKDHSRNAWKCWMWMMIMFVVITFVGTVLFMKIVKKRKY